MLGIAVYACFLTPATPFVSPQPLLRAAPALVRYSAVLSRIPPPEPSARLSRSAFVRTCGVVAASFCIPRKAGALDLQAQQSNPVAAVYDAVGRWLADHPAPLWLVNNPVKKWLATRSAGNYDQAATRTTLEKLVADDDVVIFSATYCPFSLAAKRTLAGQGVDFQAYEWNTRPDGAALVAELGVLTGRTSIPHIFIGGKSIGGFNDGTPGLRPLINSGQFDETVLQSKTRRAAGETPAKPLAIFGSSGSASQAPSP